MYHDEKMDTFVVEFAEGSTLNFCLHLFDLLHALNIALFEQDGLEII